MKLFYMLSYKPTQSTQPILPIQRNDFFFIIFFNFSIREFCLSIWLITLCVRVDNSMMDSMIFKKGRKLIIIKICCLIANNCLRTSKLRNYFLFK